jgi:hypothetical protein
MNNSLTPQIYKMILDIQLLKKNKFIFNKMYFVLFFFVTLIYQRLKVGHENVR